MSKRASGAGQHTGYKSPATENRALGNQIDCRKKKKKNRETETLTQQVCSSRFSKKIDFLIIWREG